MSQELEAETLDRYDAIIMTAALFTSLTTRNLADIYARGEALFTGAFSKQHIHETIVKKNVLKMLESIE
jgi:hypothetical protein